MKSSFPILIFFALSNSMQAIDFYQPGDTLYVWAISGLTLRKEASLKAAKLATIPYATLLVAQNYSGMRDVEVEAVPSFTSNNQKNPSVILKGGFAMVIFQGDTGFVFNGYLSKLPAMKRTIDKQNNQPIFERFEDWAKRNFGLMVEIKRGKWEHGSPSSAKWVYGNGFSVDSWAEKVGESRTILPDISMEEAFLIFNYLHNYEWEIRHPSNNPLDYPWGHRRENDYEWHFGTGVCGFKILYLPKEKMAVITSECSC